MIFNVLRTIYHQHGETFYVKWEVIGQAVDMEDAKRRFGGYPVLEAVR